MAVDSQVNRDEKQTPLLEMRLVNKAFPGVQALRNVSLAVWPGQVLALVGENGAGKSTLMKILSGLYAKDSGDILLDGVPVDIRDPLSSQKMGISIIYQELNLLNNLSIAENIFLGREIKGPHGLVNHRAQETQAGKLLAQVGLAIDPHTRVGKLSTAQKQMVEVAKALSFNSRLIIMDEPTSSLTETETRTLFQIIRQLKQSGVAIVFISHRMNEIFEIADQIAVMRDGEMIDRFLTSRVTQGEIISSMVGRELKTLFVKEDAQIGSKVLEVKNLSTRGGLRDISFSLRAGEILGFAGLVGAGRSEVMRALFGLDPRQAGEIFIDGQPVSIRSTADALKLGLGFVPEDRKEQGLVLGMPVYKNITLAALRRLVKQFLLRRAPEEALAGEFVRSLQIKTPSLAQRVMNLSGGNQQKVVIAKWLANQPRILILDEPTRGIDVGAKKEVHMLMSKLAQQGVAIIMISSELPEVLAMADRVIVMHQGRIKGELARQDATQESIMAMAVS